MSGPGQGLPYEPDDDESANGFINVQLRTPDESVWTMLFSLRYADQTLRILKRFQASLNNQSQQRKAIVAEADARRVAGEVTEYARRTAYADYEKWRARIGGVRQAIEQRVDQGKLHRHRLFTQEHYDLLMSLATAVEDHRRSIQNYRAVTAEDRLLWEMLDLLRLPGSDSPSISNILAARRKKGD